VTIVDANVLLYAVNRSAPNRRQAQAWLEAALGGHETVAFTWIVMLAFLRLSTHEGVFPQPLTLDTAVATLRGWLSQPSAVVLEPSSRHIDVLAGLLAQTGTAANLVNDAHLAAIAIEHDGEIVSFDADFGRFSGVRWTRP
jgi:uncharacterized protein